MEVHSIQEYIDIIEKLGKAYTYKLHENIFFEQEIIPQFIYRGHGNGDKYKLLPGVFREKRRPNGAITTEYSQLEYNIVGDFISEARRYVPNIHNEDILSWIEIAQHFGVPTRLLDFTQNPLVALYFACKGLSEHDACVWIINELAYKKVFWENSEIVLLKNDSEFIVNKIISDEVVNQRFKPRDESKFFAYPWIYKPNYSEERMMLQASVFMIWASRRREFTDFMQPENYMKIDGVIENLEKGILFQIRIPSTEKKHILTQLELFGVNEKFIYPGLDGVGKYINRKYASEN